MGAMSTWPHLGRKRPEFRAGSMCQLESAIWDCRTENYRLRCGMEGPEQGSGKFLGIVRSRRSDDDLGNAARRLQRHVAFNEGHGVATTRSRRCVGRELRGFPDDKKPDLLLVLVGSMLNGQAIQQQLGRDQVLSHLVEKRHAGVDVGHQPGFALDGFRDDARRVVDWQMAQSAGGVSIVNRRDKDILVRLPVGLVLDAEQVGAKGTSAEITKSRT
jgi:hypothetical protein